MSCVEVWRIGARRRAVRGGSFTWYGVATTSTASSETASSRPLRSRIDPRSPGTGTVSVCWLWASALSPPPWIPCTHAARPTARQSNARQLANRSPIRRSIIGGYGAETAPVPDAVSVVGTGVVVAVGVVVVGVGSVTVGGVAVVGVIVVGVVVTAVGSVVVVVSVTADVAVAGAPAESSPDPRRLGAISASCGPGGRQGVGRGYGERT